MKKCSLFLFIHILFFHLSAGQTILSTGSLNTARWFHQSQLLQDGRVLAFGGDNCNYAAPLVFNSAEIYNPNSQIWTYTGSMNAKRTRFSSVLLDNGKVLAIGGLDENDELKNSCELYDPATGTWTYTGSLNAKRTECASIKLLDGRVLVVGGSLDSIQSFMILLPEPGLIRIIITKIFGWEHPLRCWMMAARW